VGVPPGRPARPDDEGFVQPEAGRIELQYQTCGREGRVFTGLYRSGKPACVLVNVGARRWPKTLVVEALPLPVDVVAHRSWPS
jgi:hypothetical protein